VQVNILTENSKWGIEASKNTTFLFVKLQLTSQCHFMLKFPGKGAGAVGFLISQKLTELDLKFNILTIFLPGTRPD